LNSFKAALSTTELALNSIIKDGSINQPALLND